MNRLFIWDSDTKGSLKYFDASDEEVVYNQSDFDKKLADKKNTIEQIIILAELEWYENFENFYGFQIATELRRDRELLCPVVLASFFPQTHFEASSIKKPEQYNILFGPGTLFVDLTELKDNLDSDKDFLVNYISKLPVLTPATLEDVIEMLLKLQGFIIDKITHDLKFQLSADELNNVFENIRAYLSEGQLERISFTKNQEKIIETKNNNKEDYFNKEKKLFCDVCESELGEGKKISMEQNDKVEKIGKVLVIEDDPYQSTDIQKNLEKQFELIVKNECHEAISEIESDSDNDIIAVIADWRLLKYEGNSPTKYWQDYQGYQILQQAAQSNFVALISLTAENDKNVHQIRNHLGLDIQLFKKEHIYSEKDTTQWGLFADVVKAKCEEIKELIASQPSGANWESLYKETYKKQRNQPDWMIFKTEVTEKADNLWEYYQKALTTEHFGFLKGLDGCGVELKNNLTNVLIARRIFFALYFSFEKIRHDVSQAWDSPEQKIEIMRNNEKVEVGSSALDAFSILRNRYWNEAKEYSTNNPETTDPESEFKKFNQAKNNLLGALCIGEKELPQNPRILPEERTWLLKNGIDLSVQATTFDDEDR